MDLPSIAASLPSMGGRQIGELLADYASKVPAGQSIVEVGCWLGSGTAHLAMGALGAPIHVYDRFHARPSEVRKAAAAGIDLEEGENTLPRVMRSLESFKADITWHRGEIAETKWDGGPIGLYVDDAAKTARKWLHVSSTFLPHVPAGGVVVLMDYYYHEVGGSAFAVQARYMGARGSIFELVNDRPNGTTVAVFRRC